MKYLVSIFIVLMLSGCMGGVIKVKDKKDQETCYLVYFSLLRYVAGGTVDACGVTGGSDIGKSETEVISEIIDVYKNPLQGTKVPFSLLKEIK